MKVYQTAKEKLIEVDSLWGAICVDLVPHMVISLVGAGGKTSVMYQLAEEFKNMGKRVIITTTTHIFCPSSNKIKVAGSLSEAAEFCKEKDSIVVGRKIKDNKLEGLSLEETSCLIHLADVLLVEADGARRLPLKMPSEKEPVLLPETNLVIACTGLTCIGKPLKKICFRQEETAKFLDTLEEHCVTIEDIVKIMISETGGKKNVQNQLFRIVLNQADDSETLQSAYKIARQIKEKTKDRCIITSFGRGDGNEFI